MYDITSQVEINDQIILVNMHVCIFFVIFTTLETKEGNSQYTVLSLPSISNETTWYQ